MIRAESICRRQGGLMDVSLDIELGKLTAIIGSNGAGKSTLLDILTGRKKADTGRVVFAGRDIAAWQPLELARMRAFLSQSTEVAFDIGVSDLVALGRAPYFNEGRQMDAMATDLALRQTNTWHLRNRGYYQLSGGERQRVQLARAIAQTWRPTAQDDPRLLMLDEPTASLDPGHRLAVMRMLRSLADDGIGVVLALHDLNDAVRYADAVILLHGGRLIATGRPAEVLQPAILKEAYGAEVDIVRASDGAPVILFH